MSGSEFFPTDHEAKQIPDGDFVFLGGTVGQNNYRPSLINKLENINPELLDTVFDPTVADGTWSEADRLVEEEAKRRAKYHLYYITNPNGDNTISMYSIAEAVDSINQRPNNTIVVFDTAAKYTGHQEKQINAIEEIVKQRGSVSLNGLDDVAGWLTGKFISEPEKVAEQSVTEGSMVPETPKKLPPLKELRARVLVAKWRLGTLGTSKVICSPIIDEGVSQRAADLMPGHISARLLNDPRARDWSNKVLVFNTRYQ